MNERVGTVQVYTGNGKGKTTAALGQALRAMGHGWRVLMIQFMKGDPDYGEVRVASTLPNFTLVQSGLPTFVKKGEPTAEDLRLAREGFTKARDAVTSRQYDLIILDEVNVAIDYGLLDLEDVLELINSRPPDLELILTGRYAHPRILQAVDLVSEMVEVKHHYRRGVQARQGIEY